MIMKPKAKKFCFVKLFVFGLIMLLLQIATFMGSLPDSIESLEEAGKLEIAEAAFSDYAQLYSYTNESPLMSTFVFHESAIIGLACIAAVIAANFRSKTLSKTIATGCWAFAGMNFIIHLVFAIIDSTSWYTPYSITECSPLYFGILTTVIAAVLGALAFFSDPVVDIITAKVEAKRWETYQTERAASRQESIDSEARKAAADAAKITQ